MEFIIAFIAFAFFFLFMALGLIVQGKPLKGSCGGVAKLMGNEDCEICGGDPLKCDEEQEKQSQANENKDLAYDASKTKS